jgi:hypothetical protein
MQFFFVHQFRRCFSYVAHHRTTRGGDFVHHRTTRGGDFVHHREGILSTIEQLGEGILSTIGRGFCPP